MSRVLDIIRTLRTTPPLPSVALRILDLVRDQDFSIDELVEIVRTDPSLTARVLRLTNSAMFSVPKEVTSVGDAISFVGTRNLVKLVLVCCAANQFRNATDSIYGRPEDLWRHSFAVATAGQWFAEHSGYTDTAGAFTAGILHNVGKVALSQTMGGEPMVAAPHSSTRTGCEAQLFGVDHAGAAGVIADAWTLPRELTVALRTHHDEVAIADGPLLPAILGAADELVLAAGIGNAFPDLATGVSTAARARLHLTTDDLKRATADVMAELDRNAELLNLRGMSSR